MLAKSKPKKRQNKTTKKSQWGIKTNSLSAETKPIKQSRFPSAYSQPIHPRNTANRHKTQSYWIVSLFIVERERGVWKWLQPCWGPRENVCKCGWGVRWRRWHLWDRLLCSWRSFHGRIWRSKPSSPAATDAPTSAPHRRLSAPSAFLCKPLITSKFLNWKPANVNPIIQISNSLRRQTI